VRDGRQCLADGGTRVGVLVDEPIHRCLRQPVNENRVRGGVSTMIFSAGNSSRIVCARLKPSPSGSLTSSSSASGRCSRQSFTVSRALSVSATTQCPCCLYQRTISWRIMAMSSVTTIRTLTEAKIERYGVRKPSRVIQRSNSATFWRP
jgi:hypothetical protein